MELIQLRGISEAFSIENNSADKLYPHIFTLLCNGATALCELYNLKEMKAMPKQPRAKTENPQPKPGSHKPDKIPSMDSRDGHGLSKDHAMQAKD